MSANPTEYLKKKTFCSSMLRRFIDEIYSGKYPNLSDFANGPFKAFGCFDVDDGQLIENLIQQDLEDAERRENPKNKSRGGEGQEREGDGTIEAEKLVLFTLMSRFTADKMRRAAGVATLWDNRDKQ